MVVDRESGPKVLKSAPKSSTRIPYIFFWAIDMAIFKFINDSTLV